MALRMGASCTLLQLCCTVAILIFLTSQPLKTDDANSEGLSTAGEKGALSTPVLIYHGLFHALWSTRPCIIRRTPCIPRVAKLE